MGCLLVSLNFHRKLARANLSEFPLTHSRFPRSDMWTLGCMVSMGSEVTAPEMVDCLGAPGGSQPLLQFPEQYRCSARISLGAKSVAEAAPGEESAGLVPTGSCPMCVPELTFLGEGPPANAPAPTPAGPRKAAFLTWPWPRPATGTWFYSQPSGHGIYLGDAFSSATYKEAAWCRGGGRDGPLGLGVQPLGQLWVAQVASKDDACTRCGFWRQADEV